MSQVLISLGSNSHHPGQQVRNALRMLKEKYGEVEMSSLYITEPVGGVPQDDFVNAAIKLEVFISAEELLDDLMDMELAAARNRKSEISKGPRTLDLDIILFDDRISKCPSLELPHPRFRERRFVLVPANEIAPDFRDPLSNKTIAHLLAECKDSHWVEPLEGDVVTL